MYSNKLSTFYLENLKGHELLCWSHDGFRFCIMYRPNYIKNINAFNVCKQFINILVYSNEKNEIPIRYSYHIHNTI